MISILKQNNPHYQPNKKDVIRTELIGELTDVVIYCNEQDYKGKGFLFKCSEGCEHNPPPTEPLQDGRIEYGTSKNRIPKTVTRRDKAKTGF